MTSQQIAELARKRQPMPDGLSLSEMKLFTVLENIYVLYSADYITQDEAKKRKSAAIRTFESESFDDKVYKETSRRTAEIQRLFAGVPKENQCPVCIKAMQIFTGIIQTAGDLPPSEYKKKITEAALK